MPDFVDAQAVGFNFDTSSGQTAALAAGDCLIAACSGANFGPTPTVNALRRGGSGGTDVAPSVSDQAYFFGNGALARIGIALPSSGSAETVYASLSNAIQIAIAGATYSDVDSAHDWTTNANVDGSGSSTVASVTVPNCVAGEVCSAICFAVSENINLIAFTSVAGTTIRTQYVHSGDSFIAVAVLEKPVDADGSCTLSVNCNSAASAGMGWWVGGVALAGSGGGPTFLAAWARGSNSVIVGD